MGEGIWSFKCRNNMREIKRDSWSNNIRSRERKKSCDKRSQNNFRRWSSDMFHRTQRQGSRKEKTKWQRRGERYLRWTKRSRRTKNSKKSESKKWKNINLRTWSPNYWKPPKQPSYKRGKEWLHFKGQIQSFCRPREICRHIWRKLTGSRAKSSSNLAIKFLIIYYIKIWTKPNRVWIGLKRPSTNRRCLTDPVWWATTSRVSRSEQWRKSCCTLLFVFWRMSSMDKEIMKIFLKVLQVGAKFLNKEENNKDPKAEKQTNRQVVLKYGQTILDKERYKELEALVNQLIEEGSAPQTLSSELFLKIIKYYVLSPVEKSYINKIEAELMESVQLYPHNRKNWMTRSSRSRKRYMSNRWRN